MQRAHLAIRRKFPPLVTCFERLFFAGIVKLAIEGDTDELLELAKQSNSLAGQAPAVAPATVARRVANEAADIVDLEPELDPEEEQEALKVARGDSLPTSPCLLSRMIHCRMYSTMESPTSILPLWVLLNDEVCLKDHLPAEIAEETRKPYCIIIEHSSGLWRVEVYKQREHSLLQATRLPSAEKALEIAEGYLTVASTEIFDSCLQPLQSVILVPCQGVVTSCVH